MDLCSFRDGTFIVCCIVSCILYHICLKFYISSLFKSCNKNVWIKAAPSLLPLRPALGSISACHAALQPCAGQSNVLTTTPFFVFGFIVLMMKFLVEFIVILQLFPMSCPKRWTYCRRCIHFYVFLMPFNCINNRKSQRRGLKYVVRVLAQIAHKMWDSISALFGVNKLIFTWGDCQKH